jgi:hypothetical protein
MASTSETGHAKNVANFEDLISFCNGYGGSYNPSKAILQIGNLTTLQSNALNSIAGVTSSKTAFANATNARQTGFDPLKKLCTRIVNALDATDATDKLVKDAKTINNKIQGKRAGEKPNPVTTPGSEAAEDKTISVSQQSYDALVDNFSKLIDLVGTEPTYTPNETELQISTLQTNLGNLKATNTAVINTYTNYSNSRITRDSILYAPTSGLVDVALEVKKYVKSVFGATSPQYKQVSKLEFKRPKKK